MAETTTKTKKTTKEAPIKTETGPTFYYAVGRRKEATARVRLYIANSETLLLGDNKYTKGAIVVNNRPIESYFFGEVAKKKYLEPFRTTNNIGRFVTTIRVVGGGSSGQLDAIIHGISRALVTIDNEKYRPILKKRGFMTRDPRAKQRRKAGFAQKSRKKKQSPKR